MAVNKRDLNTLTDETGWPVVNYAQEERNFQTSPNARAGALSIPRFKFTWLVEFRLNSRALDNPVTNISDFIKNGKLYTHLLSVDHPQPSFKTEKLRSYNKWITVPTQVEYPSASMTFHDDSTSVVQALWKEHLNFYTHQATIGDTISGTNTKSNLNSARESSSYQLTNRLTSIAGDDMRSAMGRRPSLGMRLKANDARHFFDSIVLYDLGTEPDGINVYWFHNPMITSWGHDNLDKEDRTGNVRVSAAFDYEGYYFTIGQNRGRLGQYITQILGTVPGSVGEAPRKDGIARDGLERAIGVQKENGGNVREQSNVPISNLSPEEQLASVFGLGSSTKELEQTLMDVGADLENQSLSQAAAKTFPLGPETELSPLNPILVEPLSPKQLNPEIPTSFKEKGRQFEEATSKANQILEGSQGRSLTPSERKTLGAYKGRSNELLGAMRRQVAADKAKAQSSPATASALENTLKS